MKRLKEKSIYLSLLVFLIALISRLAVLFFYTEWDNPGPSWYGDVWHHWQIAYLSKEIGFKEGFLRLWDFKGMEYYWGLLHPLVLIAGFLISGSVSILVPRMVSVIFSSLAIALVFLIIGRHFNKKTAFASAIVLIFMPITLFSDTLGMQEPLGLFFLFLGIYLFPRYAFAAGFSWMLAGMVRAEYWLFGAGLLLAVLIRGRSLDRKVITLLGYGLPCLFYLKYMLDQTGNPIYPIYWNYLAIFLGKWFKSTQEVVSSVQNFKCIFQAMTIFFFVSGLAVLGKKPKGHLLFLLGLANLTMLFFVLGFGGYLYSYGLLSFEAGGFITRLWVSRLFAWPGGFLGILSAILLFYFLPKKAGRSGVILGTFLFLLLLGASQLLWPSINYHYNSARESLALKKNMAQAAAKNYQGKGKILIPDNQPALTYLLIYYEKIPAQNLVSSFYGPFYYYQGDDPFSDWETFREEIKDWLGKENISLFVFGGGENGKTYQKMLEREENRLFKLIDQGEEYCIYEVTLSQN